MQDTSRSLVAEELATAFMYAELHCALLLRLIRDENVSMPQMPPFDKEQILLEEFTAHIDDISLIELKATLRAVSLAFGQVQAGGQYAVEDNKASLGAARTRLHRARGWLVQVADHGLRAPLGAGKLSEPDRGLIQRKLDSTSRMQR